MKPKSHRSNRAYVAAAPLIAAVLMLVPFRSQGAGALDFNPYRAAAPSIDVNLMAVGLRAATSAQLTALNQFKDAYGSKAVVRWNPLTGSPDVMMGFHTAPGLDRQFETAKPRRATRIRIDCRILWTG